MRCCRRDVEVKNLVVSSVWLCKVTELQRPVKCPSPFNTFGPGSRGFTRQPENSKRAHSGLAHDSPRTPNVHISGPRRFKTPPKSTKGPPRERRRKENCGGEGKKRKNLGPPTLRGPTLFFPNEREAEFSHESVSHQKHSPTQARMVKIALNLVRIEAPDRPHPGRPSVREENLEKRVQQPTPGSNSTGASTPAPFGVAPQRAPTSPWPLRAT